MRRSICAGVVSVLLLSAALCAQASSAPASYRAFQQTVIDGLNHAQRCIDQGRFEEAEAYAKMVLVADSVKVYVDYGTLPQNRKADGRAAIEQATARWESATGQEIRFDFVQRSQADVHITFSNYLTYVGKPAGGVAVWRRNVIAWNANRFTPQLRATIQLALATGPRGEEIGVEQMTHAAMHELGHILGLRDNPRRGNIMGPLDLNKPVSSPSKDEVTALLEVRSEAWSVMRMAATNSSTDFTLQTFTAQEG